MNLRSESQNKSLKAVVILKREEHDNIPGFREHDVYIQCG